MKYRNEKVMGGTVTLYDITQWGSLHDWDASALAEYVAEKQVVGITKNTDREGTVLFSDLAEGQYLLVQQEAAEGYYPMQPFILTIPLVMNGETLLDIVAEPKLERIPQDSLPQTGQLQWPVWMMGGLGILFAGAGLLIWKKE